MFTGDNALTCRETPRWRGVLGWGVSPGRAGALPRDAQLPHGGDEAVVAALLRVEDPVFDEDGDGSQHERRKQVHVDEVSGAMQLPTPAGRRRKRL